MGRHRVNVGSRKLPQSACSVKEVEVVDSVGDLTKSQSVRGHRFQIFGMLHAKIASSVKKIIQNLNFEKESLLDSRRLNQVIESFAETHRFYDP